MFSHQPYILYYYINKFWDNNQPRICPAAYQQSPLMTAINECRHLICDSVKRRTGERRRVRSIIHSASMQASKQQTNKLINRKLTHHIGCRRRRLPPTTTPPMPPLPLLLPFDLPPSSFSFLSFLTELSIHTIYLNLKPRHTVLCLFQMRPKIDTMLSSGMFWVSWEEKISMFQVC